MFPLPLGEGEGEGRRSPTISARFHNRRYSHVVKVMIERDAAHTDRAARVVEAARQHEAALLGYLGRMLGDADEAADVLQDTLERALDGRRPLPSDSELRPWLYRVATNRAIDVIRRRRFTATWTAEPAIGRTTEGEVEDVVLLKAVAAFVRGLPPKQRAALVMRR